MINNKIFKLALVIIIFATILISVAYLAGYFPGSEVIVPRNGDS